MGQDVADTLVKAGVRSFVDFTGIPLRVPDEVFVDHMDITSALESAAFFARQEQVDDGAENGVEGDGENGDGGVEGNGATGHVPDNPHHRLTLGGG